MLELLVPRGILCVDGDGSRILYRKGPAGPLEKERSPFAALDHGDLDAGETRRPDYSGEAGARTDVGNPAMLQAQLVGQLQAFEEEPFASRQRVLSGDEPERPIPVQHLGKEGCQELCRLSMKTLN